METLNCDSFCVCYGTGAEVLEERPAAEYVIAKTDPLRIKEISELQQAGFVFHERFIKMEFDIGRAVSALPMAPHTGAVTVQETEEFTDKMLDLAVAAYGTDRRFHLGLDFSDNAAAKEVITATAEKYMSQHARIVTAKHEDELLGFCTFLKNGSSYYNAMGLTARNMKGKMAAWPLYTQSLELLKNTGGYMGIISPANAASLNLHIQLGARVTGIFCVIIGPVKHNKLF